MAISSISNAARSAACDGIVDAIDTGTTDATGDFLVYTAAHALLLAELTFSNPAFGAASAGVATASAITSDTNANNNGTAAAGRVQDRDNATVFDFSVGTSGQDFNLNTDSISAGDTVACTAMTVTMPAS